MEHPKLRDEIIELYINENIKNITKIKIISDDDDYYSTIYLHICIKKKNEKKNEKKNIIGMKTLEYIGDNLEKMTSLFFLGINGNILTHNISCFKNKPKSLKMLETTDITQFSDLFLQNINNTREGYSAETDTFNW